MAKKNRFTAILLLLLVFALLAGCSGSGDVKPPSDTSVGGSSTGEPSGNTDAEPPEDENAGASNEITVAETVLYENGGVKVTATGYSDSWMGPEISILVENDSEKNIQVSTRDVSVNSYMMQFSGMYAEVSAGKKSNETLSLLSSELKQSGVETVADIQFYLSISDADTWDEIEISTLITLSTSASGFEQPVDDSGDVLHDADGIKVVCKGLKQDIVWDGTIVFYMENGTEQPITVYAENVSVNGFMQDASLWAELRGGTRAIDGLSLLDLSDLELDSIDDIESIEFNLRIINSDTWDEILTTDAITLTF